MPITTPAGLVAALRQQRLLKPEQLSTLTPEFLARFSDGKALARELIQRGWLTARQANRLLQGRAKGPSPGSALSGADSDEGFVFYPQPKRRSRKRVFLAGTAVLAFLVLGLCFAWRWHGQETVPQRGEPGAAPLTQADPIQDAGLKVQKSPLPEGKPEHQPEQQPEGKVEAKPEVAPDAKSEKEPEGKPEPKTETEPGPKPELASEKEAESKPESKPEPKPETKPEKKPEPAFEKTAKPSDKKAQAAALIQKEVFNYLAKKDGARQTAPVSKDDDWGWKEYQAASKRKNAPVQLYQLIHSHLLRAEALLNSNTLQERRNGLGMAFEACNCAAENLKDAWLCTRIADGFLLPNLDAANVLAWHVLSQERVINSCLCAYILAKDNKRYIEGYRRLLQYGKETSNRNTADAARLKLAEVLEREGEFAEALKHLRDVDQEGSLRGGLMMVPRIQKKLEEKQKKSKAK